MKTEEFVVGVSQIRDGEKWICPICDLVGVLLERVVMEIKSIGFLKFL